MDDSDMSADRLLPSSSSAYDLAREPEILPRIGDAFQAEFPELVSRSEYLLLLRNGEDGQSGASEPSVGLSMPVLLPSRDHGSTKRGKAKASNHSRKGAGESVPLSEPACWTDMEKSSFLVGLYIFQKNFVQLTEFMETRSTGDIMAYYYGRFYRSQEYSRWSDTRKMRSRRCIFGHKMFTGARQQELLVRLFSNASEDCQSALAEVSRTFSEGKIPLPEYVSSMKGLVGLRLLVEAVGIGKGKQDLTSVGFEPSQASQSIQIRPEIPTGKACANLSVSQIVQYLTGDYRKSKAKFTDLFFAAVWPRLLERGWHSEEPKDPGYPVAVHTKPVVFLVPGVVNIARRRLVKGTHFYDSISDVLSKVAKDPSLLELDTEGNNERIGGENDMMLEDDDAPTRSRRYYLQPRTTTRTSPCMRFTIVDASSDGEKAHTLKELKFPGEFNKPAPRILVQLTDQDSPKAAADTVFLKKKVKHDGPSQAMINPVPLQNKSGPASQPVNNSSRTDILKEKPQKKAARRRMPSQSTKEEDDRPVNKRPRRLTVCSQEKAAVFPASESMDISGSEENVPTLDLSDAKQEPAPSSHSEPAPSSHSEPAPSSHSEPAPSSHSEPAQSSHSEPLIDLNIPQVSVDDENDVLMEDAAGSRNNAAGNLVVEVNIDPGSDQQNQQRRGTRNRPPTSRALEALANGFLTVNSRGKGGSRTRSTPRPSRQARGIARLGIGKTPLAPIPEESKTPSASSKGGQSAAGSDPDKGQPGEFEVLSAPASGN